MNDLNLPNLTFPMIQYGKHETPLDLLPLLYRGGAGSKANLVAKLILHGDLGEPIVNRVLLVKNIHEYIEGKLAGGGRRGSADTAIRRLREFFAWVDKVGGNVTMESVESMFIEWTDHLLHRQRVVGDISEIHAYQSAVSVAKIFDGVLELRHGLLIKTRIRKSKRHRNILSPNADKQNIEQTFAFGHALLDITEALSVDAIRGPMPVAIVFRTGQIIEEWLKLKPLDSLKTLRETVKPSTRKATLAKRSAWEADNSVRTRYPLINLRIECEMLIFIAQTGMNLEQAYTLRVSKFRCQSHIDGYLVYRVYKGRRHGEVAFEIFSEYRRMFERYLEWRATIFPGDDEGLLFPLVTAGREGKSPSFSMASRYCRKLGIRFIYSRALRKTRINWMLRRSQDPKITAEMHAHTQEVLIRYYEQPSLQVAMLEISRFHAHTDPAIAPPGPGLCVELAPMIVPGFPAEASEPDCVSPAGCIFCMHHRDIDSEDHVWSLASYRHLKTLELARYRPAKNSRTPHPAMVVIERITGKLKYFEQSSEVRRLWVREALARIEEGDYHQRWDGFIQLIEAQQ